MHLVQRPGGGLHRSLLSRCFGIVGASLFTITVLGSEAHAGPALAHWVMPPIAVPEADRPEGPNVFDTVAVPVRARPTSTRWTKLMRASLAQPALIRFTADARRLPPVGQAAFVQLKLGRALRSRPGSYDCSDDGYWAAAGETLVRRTGDCIDVAIAKMEALRLLGIPKKDLYLTTGYFGEEAQFEKGRESAALLVKIGHDFWLLPERSDHIIKAEAAERAYSNFRPILTYGVGMTWIHGRRVKTAMLGD